MGAWRSGFSLGQACWVAAQREDMCGRKGSRRGGELRKRKLHFSCASSSDSSVKLEMMVIKTERLDRQ